MWFILLAILASAVECHWINGLRSASSQSLPEYSVDVRNVLEKQAKINTYVESLANDTNIVHDYEFLSAEAHYLEMKDRTSCSAPRPHVVCVKDHYPDADINYRPACTILHRCDSTSGCCENPKHSCQPASSSLVTLHFIVDKEDQILKLDFTNHTECRCDVREDLDITPKPHEGQASLPDANQEFGGEIDTEENAEDEESETSLCDRCPHPFSKRLVKDTCQCDCFADDHECLRIKSGKAPLAELERRCVQRRECIEPSCGRGLHFNLDFGECRRAVYESMSSSGEKPVSKKRRRHHKHLSR